MKRSGAAIKRAFLAHRLWILTAAGIVVVISAYGIWSRVMWDDYVTRYENWQTQARQQFDAVLALPTSSDEDRQKKLQALTTSSDKISDVQGSICSINALVGWQRLIQTLSEREKTCQEARERLAELGKDINELVMYMRNEQALAAIISSLAVKTELADSEWEAQAAAWRAAVGKVKGLKVQPDFSPVKQKATKVIEQVDVAWQAVLTAHRTKDKAAYMLAQSQLIQAYGALGTITDTSVQQIEKLFKTVVTSRQTAFN